MLMTSKRNKRTPKSHRHKERQVKATANRSEPLDVCTGGRLASSAETAPGRRLVGGCPLGPRRLGGLCTEHSAKRCAPAPLHRRPPSLSDGSGSLWTRWPWRPPARPALAERECVLAVRNAPTVERRDISNSSKDQRQHEARVVTSKPIHEYERG